MFGTFMVILDSTIVNIAFSTLRLEFGTSLIRVLDESFGESGSETGYLYPTRMFAAVRLPEAARKVFEHVYS